MAQDDSSGLRSVVSLFKRLFGGANQPTAAASDTATALVLTEENRGELLLLAQQAPFAYGYWSQVKKLYKAAESAGDWQILHALAARLDTQPFAEKPEMLPTPLTQAKLTDMTRLVVSGSLAYILTTEGLTIADISDPVQPRLLGSIKLSSPLDIVLDGTRAFVVEGYRHYNQNGAVNVLDISDPTHPVSLARHTLQYPVRLTLVGNYVAVLTNYYNSAGLTLLDFANLQSPLTVSFTKINSPIALCAAGRNLYIVSGETYRNTQKIFTYDVSDPIKPSQINTLSTPTAWDITSDNGYLYTAVGRANYYSQTDYNEGLYIYRLDDRGIPAVTPTIMKLGMAKSVAVRGRHAYLGVDGAGYHDYKAGGLRIVDIAVPAQPKLVCELNGGYITGLSAPAEDPGHVYFGLQTRAYQPHYLQAADIRQIEKPTLMGTLPSNQTFGYMKRRARRALRNLAEQDPAQYVYQATQLLLTTGKDRAELDPRTQWLSMDILYGNSRRYEQASHGRGAYLLRGNAFHLRTREERHPELWDRHPLLAESLYTLTDLPWQTQEAACKMLRGMKRTLPDVPDTTLIRFLQSPSSLLIAVASRAFAAKLQTDQTIPADIAAETFFKGSGRSRKAVRDYIARQTKLGSRWSSPFATRLYKLASDHAADGKLSRRQGLAFAYLVANFPAVLSRQVAPALAVMLYATRRPELTAWALDTLRQASPAQLDVWLQTLETLPDDLRPPAIAALTESIRGKELTDRMASALVFTGTAWTRAVGWDLVAASATSDAVLTKVWDELLSATFETVGLRSAIDSPAALVLFNRLSLDGSRLQGLLETRPFLVGLLPQSVLQNIVRILPVGSILGLVQAATDAQWPELRTTIANGLVQSGQLTAFWQQVWKRIGETGDAILTARLLDDEVLSATFLTVDDPDYLNTSNPAFGALLGRWVRAHDSQFVADSALLLQIATHSLPDIRDWGLERVRQVGMRLPFALRLLESELPPSVEVGRTFFEAVPPGDDREIETLLALCDSPKAPVRAYGRATLEARWEHVRHEEVFNRLAESVDPQMETFLAERLLTTDERFELAPTFDRQVLRTRDKGRAAKELVKRRLNREPSQDVPMLLEIARSRSSRDAEWALGQLARLALEGVEIEGVTVGE